MTRREIKEKLRQMESAMKEKELHRSAFEDAENVEYEARRDLVSAFCGLTGSDRGVVMVDGKVYSYGTGVGIFPMTVMDLDAFLGPDVSDPRCVKSINPDLNPADLAGIDVLV